MSVQIEIPKGEIAEFCRRNHIRRLALFGSVLRDDFTPESDVDVLVEFEPGRTPGLAFFAMQREFSGMLGRQVDLNTAAELVELQIQLARWQRTWASIWADPAQRLKIVEQSGLWSERVLDMSGLLR